MITKTNMTYNKTTTRAVLIYNENFVVLIKRVKDGRLYYILPGGGLEENETLEECVLREIKEETNLEAEIIKHIGKVLHNHEETINQEHHIFLCKNTSQEIKLGGPEQDRISENNYYEPVTIEFDKIKDLTIYPEECKEIMLRQIENL